VALSAGITQLMYGECTHNGVAGMRNGSSRAVATLLTVANATATAMMPGGVPFRLLLLLLLLILLLLLLVVVVVLLLLLLLLLLLCSSLLRPAPGPGPAFTLIVGAAPALSPRVFDWWSVCVQPCTPAQAATICSTKPLLAELRGC
jgi:hypothetical protein